ncbi:hypothetical protein B0A50_07695 [Salinomyces thailandicus]|uniref:Defect at low temperature protein 1 n=1 Tax=Salinomyces thailandicus TaxID=706561 RepID=A0A4U0TLW4_9PEZI|nr:hypothetical protein B0A50_07695 [Salinomyces thailandica]
MGRKVLPFRIPFFRIFYSTTYTILYVITLCMLAITPTTLIYSAVDSNAYQYIFMIGGVYLLVGIFAVFIYSSRLYTNRSTLAAVGKAYIPVEEGEIGRKVRKMVVEQFERSAIVAWESRPRDIQGEIETAEDTGLLPADAVNGDIDDFTVGRIIEVDPASPPWGHVTHPGWTNPSHQEGNKHPAIECADVIAEMANLIEARAVSLAPAVPSIDEEEESMIADPSVTELLCRPSTMGLRDYLTQLSYLGLVSPPEIGQSFLEQYERARFSGRPIAEDDFNGLMLDFAELLSGMTELQPEIIKQIRAQLAIDEESESESLASSERLGSTKIPPPRYRSPSRSPTPSVLSPVTAPEAQSRNVTPYLGKAPVESQETLSSVIRRAPFDDDIAEPQQLPEGSTESETESSSLMTLPSDAGSVLWHASYEEDR